MNASQRKRPQSLRGALIVLLSTVLTGQLPLGWAAANAQTAAVEVANTQTNIASETNDVSAAEVEEAPEAPEAGDRPRAVGERVRVGSSLKVLANETVREAVTVFGSSSVAGTVTRELVTVFGDSELSGAVEREMVTVFGKAKMTGRVGREMVTVFGDAEVDGPISRECVVVFGNLKLGPNAKVGRDCMAVFGTVERHPDAELEQEPVSILPMFAGVGEWITDGLMKGRLVPPGSRLAWIVVGLHLVLYGLIALLLAQPVKSCADTLASRPVASFGVGLLTCILLAPLYMILTAVGVGLVLVPFIGLAETAFVCVGKTATFEAFGFQLFRGLGRKSGGGPLLGFLVGFVIVTLLYMVPIVGLLVWLVLRPVALGAAVLACISALRRNGNGRAPGIPVPPAKSHVDLGAVSKPIVEGGSAPLADRATETGAAPPLASPPPLEVAVMPRAGFWIRLGASCLDFIALCWILMLPHVDSFFLFFWLAYHIALWSWRGTTIGGIVFNLKIVRLDGRAPDASVCVVRGLASVFSAVALLLGFFWVGWTRERQSWHDKIAGTVIVRVPKAISLI